MATASTDASPVIATPGESDWLSTGDTGTSPGEATGGTIDVLSASSLNTFLRCAKQWEFAYVYRLKRPPNLKMVVGTAGHEAVEKDLRHKVETLEDLELADVKDAFSTAYDREAVDAIEEPDKDLTKGEMKDRGVRSITFWRKEIAPPIRPMLVEQPFSYTVDGVGITGTFDLADMANAVWDHKFTNKTPSSAEAYLLNMVTYAIGFRVATGLIEKQVILDNVVALKGGPKRATFRSEGPVPDASIQAFTGVVRDVNRSIQAGLFPPTGLKSNACSWCGYRDICPAYRASGMSRD